MRRVKEEIIALLKEKDDFVSGEEIAGLMGITRAAVWKRIALLRKKGFSIEASPAKGYRLVGSPESFIEGLRDSLAGTEAARGEIIFFESVSSTNTLAMELASKGCPEWTVILADHQTGGKGRLGRKWLSPAGRNLYMSVVLRPDIHPKDAPALTLLSAVACASAIRNLSPVPVSIKWPNDIMVSKKKLAGILTEIKADPDRIDYAAVGIGLNINMGKEELPDGLDGIATSMKQETGMLYSRPAVAAGVLKELSFWYAEFLEKGNKRILEEWSRLSSTLGCSVRVRSDSDSFTGIAEKIDGSGALLLRMSDNSLKKIFSGDVTELRPMG